MKMMRMVYLQVPNGCNVHPSKLSTEAHWADGARLNLWASLYLLEFQARILNTTQIPRANDYSIRPPKPS